MDTKQTDMQRANIIGNCLQVTAAQLFSPSASYDLAGQPIHKHEDDLKYLERMVKNDGEKTSITFTIHPDALPERTRNDEDADRIAEFPQAFRKMVERWANQKRPGQSPDRVSVSEDGLTITISDTGSAWDLAGALSMVSLVKKAMRAGLSSHSEAGDANTMSSVSSTYYMPAAVDALDAMPQTSRFSSSVGKKDPFSSDYNTIVDVVTNSHDCGPVTLKLLPKTDRMDDYFREKAIGALLPPAEEIAQVDCQHAQELQPQWKEYLKTAIGQRITSAIAGGVEKHQLMEKIAEALLSDKKRIIFEDGTPETPARNFMQVLMNDRLKKAAYVTVPLIESMQAAAQVDAGEMVRYVGELCGAKISDITDRPRGRDFAL